MYLDKKHALNIISLFSKVYKTDLNFFLFFICLIMMMLCLTGTTDTGLLGGLSGGKRRKKRRIRRSPVMMQQQQQHQYPTSASPPPFIPSTMAYKYREMPFLDHRSSHRFLALMENTMEVRKITNPICKKNYVCKVYQAALSISNDPKLPDMETAIIDTFG